MGLARFNPLKGRQMKLAALGEAEVAESFGMAEERPVRTVQMLKVRLCVRDRHLRSPLAVLGKG